jgi:hypothetical protein
MDGQGHGREQEFTTADAAQAARDEEAGEKPRGDDEVVDVAGGRDVDEAGDETDPEARPNRAPRRRAELARENRGRHGHDRPDQRPAERDPPGGAREQHRPGPGDVSAARKKREVTDLVGGPLDEVVAVLHPERGSYEVVGERVPGERGRHRAAEHPKRDDAPPAEESARGDRVAEKGDDGRAGAVEIVREGRASGERARESERNAEGEHRRETHDDRGAKQPQRLEQVERDALQEERGSQRRRDPRAQRGALRDERARDTPGGDQQGAGDSGEEERGHRRAGLCPRVDHTGNHRSAGVSASDVAPRSGTPWWSSDRKRGAVRDARTGNVTGPSGPARDVAGRHSRGHRGR